jgi:hypothetical protein
LIAAGLVTVLAAIALIANPPAPPGIAEFAPNATKPITKAPPGQAPGGGNGPGACASGGVCDPKALPTRSTGTNSPTGPRPTDPRGASALQCYVWPDGAVTQTWDPQSPPCIADWPGRAAGNGGATAPGVTKTEIRIAFPRNSSTYDAGQPLVDFFNTRFELYDRRLVLVPFTPQDGDPDTGQSSPEAQRADAESVKSLGVFASFTDPGGGQWDNRTFTSRVSAAHILSVSAPDQVSLRSQAQLADKSPYAWSYWPTSDDLLAATAAMTCRQLVGRNATHSLDYSTTKRTFAVVVPQESYLGGPLEGLDHMLDTLQACGVPRPRVVEYQAPLATNDPSAITSAMLQLKADGITSVILWPPECCWAAAGAPQKAATNAGYHPEWIIAGWSAGSTAALDTGASDQLRDSFGVASWSRRQPLPRRPYFRAYSEAIGGKSPPDIVSLQPGIYESLYRSLLLIASGIQMAGEHLTAQRFGDALQSTTFANPGTGAPPMYQAHVGFADDHSMADDFAAFWFNPARPYSPTAPDTDTFCYLEAGRRWTAQSWPSDPDPYLRNCP